MSPHGRKFIHTYPFHTACHLFFSPSCPCDLLAFQRSCCDAPGGNLTIFSLCSAAPLSLCPAPITPPPPSPYRLVDFSTSKVVWLPVSCALVFAWLAELMCKVRAVMCRGSAHQNSNTFFFVTDTRHDTTRHRPAYLRRQRPSSQLRQPSKRGRGCWPFTTNHATRRTISD